MVKPTVAIHKFTSCNGCQLAFLNISEDLFELSNVVDVVHFMELGLINPEAKVDIAFIEGSVSTPENIAYLKKIRNNCRYLIALGVCSIGNGIQTLRNFACSDPLLTNVYASPEYVSTLKKAAALENYVRVDLALWGCPVTAKQCAEAVKSLTVYVPSAVF